uniref:Vps39_2 domain-containing protein n=1 Tax=Macrostomum lignano TaxID=282301 RepID=A0A1I8F427_9PLAT
ELGVPYQDLIFRYSRWIIERDPKEGLRIFTAESQADTVANFLESSAPQLLTDYLEHCVLHCKPPDTSESLHTRLANQYRLRLEQQTEPLAVAGAPGPDLLAFLRRSRHYNAQELLARYPNNDMLEERALLLSRLGQYELAFTILAQYLRVAGEGLSLLAEEILSQPTAETGDAADSSLASLQGEVYGQLIKALAGWRPCLPRPINCIYRLSRVLPLLPPATPLADLSDYLLTSLQRLEAEKRLLQSRRGLYHAERLQTAAAFARVRSGRVAIEEGTRCSVCQNRIGASAFARFPSRQVTHYGCMALFKPAMSPLQLLIKSSRSLWPLSSPPRIASRRRFINGRLNRQVGSNLKGRHFLTLRDYSESEIAQLARATLLHDALRSASTRTRVSTETASSCSAVSRCVLSPQDVHLGTNESLPDTAKVLSGFCDAVLARVYAHDSPVPSAGRCWRDFFTAYENFGHLNGLIRIASPAGYDPNPARGAGRPRAQPPVRHPAGAHTRDPRRGGSRADVIVTDTFVSMGREAEKERRLKEFQRVNSSLVAHAKPRWVFMHCLPRKQEEVTDDIFYDSKRSLVWPESHNRKWTVMSVLLNVLNDQYRPACPCRASEHSLAPWLSCFWTRAIRMWVFLPLVIITFLFGVIRHYVTILISAEKKAEPEQVSDQQ